MANIMDDFPSKYLKAADLEDREHKLVMLHIHKETVGDDDKPVLYFTKAKKGVVLNKTNAKAIASAYGYDTDNWPGKEVILYPAMVQFRDEMVESIRIKVPKAAPKPKPAPKSQEELEPAQSENPGNDMDDEIPF